MPDEARCTVNVTIHPWCSDPSRDAAVRAAEDCRTGPLPTLGEAIAAITNHDAPPGARVSDRQCASPADTGADTAGRDMGNNVFVASTAEVLAMHEKTVKALTAERDAAIRERDALRAARITQSLTADRFASAVQEADALRARVAELDAASGGGEGEPDAFGVLRNGNVDAVTHRLFRKDAERSAEQWGGTVVPLYRAPPQPRGWLTEDERDIIAGIADDDEYTEEGQNIAKALLSRSLPPEVVLPDMSVNNRCGGSEYCLGWTDAELDFRKALVAAGVAVKEAGK